MVTSNVYSVRRINAFVILIGCISSSCCIHAGLIAELNRLSPLVIKKYSQTPPLILNLKTGNQRGTGEIIHKLQAKPPSLTMIISKRLSRSIWPMPKLPVPYVLPLIPKTPLLPLSPSWLPRPTDSVLDISPSPIAKLSRVLGYSKRNTEIYKKLLELKHKGSITSAEYFRFQNLLLRI